jgi:hypothetical protein
MAGTPSAPEDGWVEGGEHYVCEGLTVAQIMFADVEGDMVRCDAIVLEGGRWARQVLVPGQPISISFHAGDDHERLSLGVTARGWAEAMAVVRLLFVADDEQSYVVLAAGGQRFVLSLPTP